MVSSGELHPEQLEVSADPHRPPEEDGEEDEENEEALSLCDLPIYSSSAGWDDEFADAGKRRSSAADQDFFEFSSEDFSNSFTYPSDNKIVFCGKIIPYRLPPDQTQKPQSKNQDRNKPKKKRGFFLFRWGSLLSNKSRNSCSRPGRMSSSKSLPLELEKYKCGYGYMPNKCVDEYDFAKVKILTPPLKSRWYLFLFGLKRLPAEMELTDIRTRQSRKTPSTMFRSGDVEVVKRGTRSAKNVPRSSGHALRAVKKTMGCMPYV
ncbi:uncharacterized protein LOC115754101 [Rhodamnia argentea]|uniref:Uncharacterized protein LOC115754101 n=1 Tax=Rhodamnia argentea TaxID=178133 RepID=A0A8B8QPB9_9MYRT|nr:uncharacterized protein LOC115754101 [Rhodamnia argentea]